MPTRPLRLHEHPNIIAVILILDLRWAGPPRNQGAKRRPVPQSFVGAPASIISLRNFLAADGPQVAL